MTALHMCVRSEQDEADWYEIIEWLQKCNE